MPDAKWPEGWSGWERGDDYRQPDGYDLWIRRSPHAVASRYYKTSTTRPFVGDVDTDSLHVTVKANMPEERERILAAVARELEASR